MNRKIKFRVWDKSQKGWVDCFGIEFRQDGIFLTDSSGDYLENNSELMQCTGLKDKNGKEIFEGDILEWVEENLGEGNIVKDRGVVEFEHGSFSIKYISICEWYNEDGTPFEIIGNIWENPELLESAKG